MDISIKQMRSKPVRLWKDIMFILFNNVTFHKKNRINRTRLLIRNNTQTAMTNMTRNRMLENKII